MTSAHPHALAQLQQLMARLDGQGFEARIIDHRLFVIAPPRVNRGGSRLVDVIAATSRPDALGRLWYQGQPRQTVIVTCKERADDGGRLWFFDGDRPIEEASHVTDAALRVGALLAGATAGR